MATEERTGTGLPTGWDPGRDVLVWVGPLSAEQRGRLPRGPRVFVVGPSEHESAADGYTRVHSKEDLFQAILGLKGALPAHALVQRPPEVRAEVQQELALTLKSALRSRALQQMRLESSWERVEHGLTNLPALADHPSIAPLRGAFAGVPCVLVSPGPSLAKNVGQLAELSRRALVVSGTHALRALARAGVAPHLVVCADPGDLARHWADVDLEPVEAFVIAATCRPATWAVPARRIFGFAGNGSTDAWIFDPLGESAGLATGGSVSCSQLSLALHLGCDPIAFVGQDLSFTERFYAAGGLDGDAEVAAAGANEFVLIKPAGATGPGAALADGRVRFTIPQRILEVPGWSGGTVRTTPTLKGFLDWFEAAVPALSAQARLLNCTEGGARIDGMEHRTLGEVSAGWQRPLEVAPSLERARSGFDAVERRRRLSTWAGDTSRSLEGCVALARRCRTLAARSSGGRGELARVEKELSSALRSVPLVSLVAQREIVQAVERARTARTLAENLGAARSLFQAVERAGELLREPLASARRALES